MEIQGIEVVLNRNFEISIFRNFDWYNLNNDGFELLIIERGNFEES